MGYRYLVLRHPVLIAGKVYEPGQVVVSESPDLDLRSGGTLRKLGEFGQTDVSIRETDAWKA